MNSESENLASLSNQSGIQRVIEQFGRWAKRKGREIKFGKEVTYPELVKQVYLVTEYQVRQGLYQGYVDIDIVLSNVVNGQPTDEDYAAATSLMNILKHHAGGALTSYEIIVDDPEQGSVPTIVYKLMPDSPDQAKPTFNASLKRLSAIAYNGQPPLDAITSTI